MTLTDQDLPVAMSTGGGVAEVYLAAPAIDPRVLLGVAPGLGSLRAPLASVVVPDSTDALPPIAATARSRVVRVELEGRRLVLKRYTEPGAFLLRTFLRASRARREAAALELVARVLPDNPVRPVAWAERRRFGFVDRSWLFTTELIDAVDLRRLDDLQGSERDVVRSIVLELLPGQVARLHGGGVFARNLHAKNVLAQPATGRVGFIDLPRAEAVGELSPGRRIHDLACLTKGLRRGLSADDLRLFFGRYVEAAGLDASPGDLEEAVARRADRLDHRTALSGSIHALRRRLKRTRLGQLVIGHRYDDPPRGGAP